MSIALDLGQAVENWFAKLQAPDDDFSQMPITYQDQAGAAAVETVAMAPVHAVENAIDSAKSAATDLTWQIAGWGAVALVAYLGIEKIGRG